MMNEANIGFFHSIMWGFVYLLTRCLQAVVPKVNLWLAGIILLSGTVQAMVSVLQYMGVWASNHPLYAATGTFDNPGPLGGYMAVCLVLAVSLWSECNNSHLQADASCLCPIDGNKLRSFGLKGGMDGYDSGIWIHACQTYPTESTQNGLDGIADVGLGGSCGIICLPSGIGRRAALIAAAEQVAIRCNEQGGRGLDTLPPFSMCQPDILCRQLIQTDIPDSLTRKR